MKEFYDHDLGNIVVKHTSASPSSSDFASDEAFFAAPGATPAGPDRGWNPNGRGGAFRACSQARHACCQPWRCSQ